MSAVRFGTDGIRGPAGKPPITYDGAIRVGRAAVRLARTLRGKRVLVCGDTRPSTPGLVDGVTVGITGEGGTAVVGGVQPTAAVALAVDAGLAEVGVQITASHNPAEDNGFKLFGAAGRKLDDAQIAAFEGWWREPVVETTATGGFLDRADAVHQAWRRAAERVLGDLGALSGVPVAIDLANGAATRCVDWLRALPMAVVLVGAGEGRINDRVGSEHPEALADAVLAHRCVAGIAVDGDGDRCVLVDEAGRVVPGDGLAWLLAWRMGVKHLAVTEMSNGGLEASLPGVHVHRTPVGDRHLRAAMDDHGWPLGCEESGHVLFRDLAGGDGLITGLRALSLLRRGERLSEAVAGYAPIPRKLTKVRVGRRPPLAEVPEIQVAVAFAHKLLGPHGRVYLRYSGTEPVLRILVEGKAGAVHTAASRIAVAAAEALGTGR